MSSDGKMHSDGKTPGHETRDVNVRAIAWAGLGLLAVATIAALAMIVVFNILAARETGRQPALSPLAAVLAPQQPPEPRLEPNPRAPLADLRAEEDAVLGSYGWVDEKAGVTRIPIERAMEIVAAQGLPVHEVKP